MSIDTDKICRTCLALSGPLLSLFDGSSGAIGTGCVADMIRDFTKLIPRTDDNMPDKVCLACISEINRCYSFKMKCENSNKTLRQLLPDAIEEQQQLHKITQTYFETPLAKVAAIKINSRHQEVQTEWNPNIPKSACPKEVQTETHYVEVATSPMKREISNPKQENEEEDMDVEEFIDYSKDDCKQRVRIFSQDCDNDEIVYELQGENEQEVIGGADDASDRGDGCTAYYVVSESKEEDENICESEDYVNGSTYNEEEELTMPHEDYNFTIINTDDGEEEIETTSQTRKRRTQRAAIKKVQLKCPECPMTFVSLKNIKKHCLKVHKWSQRDINKLESQPNKNQVCDDPDLDIELPSELETAILEQIQNDDDEDNKNKNIQIETNSSEVTNAKNSVKTPDSVAATAPTVFCPRCNAGFAYRKSLNYHMKQNQCTAKSFFCTECQRVFTTLEGLEEHRDSHMLQHACTECNLLFANKILLSTHMIEEHKRSAKNQCSVCKKVFTMLSALKDHLRIHSGEKPFLCQTCGKAFRQNANLKQHVMRHSKVKPFKCDECPVGFVSKAELFSHKRTHTGDHPFSCDMCDARYTTSSSLAKHKRKHTGERPYACEFCPLRFSALNVLKNHRRTHTGEKPFPCMYCNKGFTQKSDCQIHQRTHTGEKPYACYCGASFTHLSSMRVHHKLHLNDVTSKKRRKQPSASDGSPQDATTLTIIENSTQEEDDDGVTLFVNNVSESDTELLQMAMENI